jgi:hydrogenase-4 component F
MIEPGIIGVVGIPAAAVLVLVLLPTYRLAAPMNVLASFGNLLAGLSLFSTPHFTDNIFIVDDFNIYLIVLNTFVGFTTSVFSATYIGHELGTGRLTLPLMRFYHAHVPDHDRGDESGARLQ